MGNKFYIDSDIKKAETLPAYLYKDEQIFKEIKEKIFLKSWHYIGDENSVALPQSVYPLVLLDNYLTEPILIVRNEDDKINCFTNVCTHRGNLVALQPGKVKKLTCMYHGRRFSLNGEFEYMPEFEEAENFPRPCDHLHQFPLEKWGPLLFAGLNPEFQFSKVINKMKERIGFLPFEEFYLDPTSSKDFLVHAHWALYCDNYLEGFHVPFVHEGLNKVLDYGSYKTETYEHCNLQIGYTDDATEVFDLPEGHPDHGKNVAAYYYWVFPNMMFNFYNWGISINIIEPINKQKTRIRFLSFPIKGFSPPNNKSSDLNTVEQEDQQVVLSVQKGITSFNYNGGRYSAKHEQGLHYFHQLILRYLK